MGARKGGERSSPPCLPLLLKLQHEPTNNIRKGGGTMHITTVRGRKRRNKEKKTKERRKEGRKRRK